MARDDEVPAQDVTGATMRNDRSPSTASVCTGRDPQWIAAIVRQARIRCRRALRTVAIRAIEPTLSDWVGWGLMCVDRRRALHFRGWLTRIRFRNLDQTDFWGVAQRAYPSDFAFVRNRIDAALRSGRIAEAETGFDALVQSRATRAADSAFVIGLSHVDQRGGNVPGIRERIRRFLGSLKGTDEYRPAALRLSRLIFAYFPRRPRRDEVDDESAIYRKRLLSMLTHSHVCREPEHLLERVAACESRIEQATRQTLFDTDVSRNKCLLFVALVRAKLAAKEPFSFVRVGDGDAACLPYEPQLSTLARGDALRRERIWWGVPLRQDVRARLTPLVARAIWDADCIGVPTTARFLRELDLQRNDTLEMSLTGRGLRSILYCTEQFETLRTRGLPAPTFTSCHLHQDLARWNCYDELLVNAGEIVLVSCHPGLVEWMRERFGVRIAGNIVLPPDLVSGPLLAETLVERRRLPEMLDEVASQIGDLPRHRLTLVGAGYPGKWLVALAKERGGIALDLGSIFDYWLGVPTRSYLDMSPA